VLYKKRQAVINAHFAKSGTKPLRNLELIMNDYAEKLHKKTLIWFTLMKTNNMHDDITTSGTMLEQVSYSDTLATDTR
jgi:hypothetical protein